MSVIDAFHYNGERDILRIHLNVLDRYVDKFIILEAKHTFSGKPKPLYFFRDQRYFKPWWHKIEYFVVDEDYTDEEITLANNSPNTVGAVHWKTEFLQKESLKKALFAAKLRDGDVVYIGDVDEIWQYAPMYLPAKLKLRVYTYYLDNRSNEDFWGTYVAPWGYIKDKVLNHERSRRDILTVDPFGWHFTSMGGADEVRRKLRDSYTEDSYDKAHIRDNMEIYLQQNLDILGRPFTYTQDPSEWPEYLTKNKERYQHLLCPKS